MKKWANRDTLDAVTYSAALVMMADGSAEEEEVKKTLQLLYSRDELKSFYNLQEIKQSIDRAVEFVGKQLDVDTDIGTDVILDRIGKVANDTERALWTFRVGFSVAKADGEVSKEESITLTKIAKRLKLNPADFGL